MSDREDTMNEDDVVVLKTSAKMHSAPAENIDVTAARYSPAFSQQSRDPIQARQPRDEQRYPDEYQDPQRRRSDQLERPGKPGDAVPGDYDVEDDDDDLVAANRQPKQRSAPQRNSPADGLLNGPTQRYHNGYYGNGHYGSGGESPDVRRGGNVIVERLGGWQRAPTDDQWRHSYGRYSSHDDRVDTPQSGRLSQSAMMVQQMYEDGDFDQEVAVSRGSTRHSQMRFRFS